MSRDTDLIEISGNRADTWKENRGEKELFASLASFTSWRCSGNVAQDVANVLNLFETVFVSQDLQIIESAIAGVKRVQNDADGADARSLYDKILGALDDDYEYVKSISQGRELPAALETAAMQEVAQKLVDNEAASKKPNQGMAGRV